MILTVTAGSESDTEIKTGYITVSAPVRLELVTRTITYTYDGLYRLTGADYSSGKEFEYAYDAVGNQIAMTDSSGVHVYIYDAANRLTSRDRVTYTWDNRGNLINKCNGQQHFELNTNATNGRMARILFKISKNYSWNSFIRAIRDKNSAVCRGRHVQHLVDYYTI